MRTAILIFSFIAFVSCASAQATDEFSPEDLKLSCLSLLTPDPLRSVSIIWYPRGLDPFLSHVKLEVDGTLWTGQGGYADDLTLKVAERASGIAKRGGFFRFHLRVNDAEFNRIQGYLNENNGKRMFQTCVSSACKAINKNAGMIIPPPFSHLPVLAVLYMTLTRKFGYTRITKIEYMGTGALKDVLLASISMELGLVAGGIALIVYGYNQAGEMIREVVTVNADSAPGVNP